MDYALVYNKLGLIGNDIEFKEEDFFTLKPKQKITQIGNGKENGTIRTDNFITPLEYVGSIECKFDKIEKMYAFKVPEKLDGKDVYILYGMTSDEIYTEAVFSQKDRVNKKTSGYMRFYKPEFKIIN